MRYGVTGLRDFNGKLYDNQDYVDSILDRFVDQGLGSIVSGGGRGVERLVDAWAHRNAYPFQVIMPNIQAHGRRDAFLLRNLEIIKVCDALIIFWDGIHNNGIIRPLGSAVSAGKPVHIIPVK